MSQVTQTESTNNSGSMYYAITPPGLESALLLLGQTLIKSASARLEQDAAQSLIASKVGVKAARENQKAAIHEAIGQGLGGLGELVSGGLQTGANVWGIRERANFRAPGSEEFANAERNLEAIRGVRPDLEIADGAAAFGPRTEAIETRIAELINNPEEFGNVLSGTDIEAITAARPDELAQMEEGATNYRSELRQSMSTARENHFSQIIRPRIDAAFGAGLIAGGGLNMGRGAENAEAAPDRKDGAIDTVVEKLAASIANQDGTVAQQYVQQAFETIRQLVAVTAGNAGQ